MSDAQVRVFARLTKVDEEKRVVYGRATEEIGDRAQEIFDYTTSKPYFEEWSASCYKDSGGKSFGNLRAMHSAVAAGKLEDLIFVDNQKAIDVSCKVVDDAEWKKVLEGVYTGFSVGGTYIKKWTDKEDASKKRYTAKPTEISLVDRPCVPTAKFFDIIKADGSTVHKDFVQPADSVSGIAPHDGAKPRKGKRAVKKMIERVTLKKGIGAVAYFANLIRDLEQFMQGQKWEAEHEEDDSKIPGKLRATIQVLSRLLAEMAIEESDEMMAEGDAENPVAYVYRAFGMPADAADAKALMTKFDVPEDTQELLLKVGARNSKTDMAHIQAMHDAACTLGAKCAQAVEGDAAAANSKPVAKADTTEGTQMAEQEELNKGEIEGAKRGTTVTKPSAPPQSENTEKDSKRGKAEGAESSKAAASDEDDEETADEKKNRFAARKAKKAADLRSELGMGEGPALTKADVATAVVETLLALGIVQKAEPGAAASAPAQAAKPAPVLTAVNKADGSGAALDTDAALAKVAPIQQGQDVNKSATLIKALHAAGPTFVDRLGQ